MTTYWLNGETTGFNGILEDDYEPSAPPAALSTKESESPKTLTSSEPQTPVSTGKVRLERSVESPNVIVLSESSRRDNLFSNGVLPNRVSNFQSSQTHPNSVTAVSSLAKSLKLVNSSETSVCQKSMQNHTNIFSKPIKPPAAFANTPEENVLSLPPQLQSQNRESTKCQLNQHCPPPPLRPPPPPPIPARKESDGIHSNRPYSPKPRPPPRPAKSSPVLANKAANKV